MFFLFSKEASKKAVLLLITFLGYLLGISLFIHATGLFLERIGPDHLPYVLLLVGVLLVGYSLLSVKLTEKFSAASIFLVTLFLFFIFYGLLAAFPLSLLLIGVFCLLSVFFYSLLDLSIVNFCASFLTPLQAKHFLPLTFGTTSLALIFGSYFATTFQAINERTRIGFIPAVILSVLCVLVLFMKANFKDEIEKSLAAASVAARETGGIRRSFDFVAHKSRLFKLVAMAFFLIQGLEVLTGFKLKTAIALSLPPEQITGALGHVYLAESVAVTFVSFFLVERLLFRFGVVNLLLFFPISLLVALSVAAGFGLPLLFTIGYYLTFAASYYSYVYIAGSQIFSVAPRAINQSVYFLIRGLLSSISYLFFSSVLLIYTVNIGLEKWLNTGFLAVLMISAIVIILKIRRAYLENLKQNLFSTDVFLRNRSIELLAEKCNRDIGERYLRFLLEVKDLSVGVKTTVMTSLGVIGNFESIVDLVGVLQSDPDPKNKFAAIQSIRAILKDYRKINDYPITRHVLLRTFEESFLSNIPLYLKLEIIAALTHFDLEDVLQFLETHLSHDDPKIKINILETLASFHDRGVKIYMAPFLQDPDLRIVCAAITGLWQFPDMRLLLIPRMSFMLEGKTPEFIENSFYLIGRLRATWERNYVLEKINHPDNRIRTYALLALIEIGDTSNLDALINKIYELARSNEYELLDLVFSHYRHFDDDTKEQFLSKIQQKNELIVNSFAESMRNSKYVFSRELNALT